MHIQLRDFKRNYWSWITVWENLLCCKVAESHGEDVLHPPKRKNPLPSEASAIALELGP